MAELIPIQLQRSRNDIRWITSLIGTMIQRELTDRLQREHGIIIPWVFHRKGKRTLDFRKAWRNAVRGAGIAGRIPHDFRRTAVRNLERSGVPRSMAMKLVGHKTEAIYRRYAIVARQLE